MSRFPWGTGGRFAFVAAAATLACHLAGAGANAQERATGAGNPVLASSAANMLASGSDNTALATEAADPISDDFSGPALNTNLWTIVNPLNDAEFSPVGTNTADARLRISVPAGPSHSIWTDGINAPRIMQPMADTDFSVEVKFDSPMTSRYQMQGICVEGDNNRYLRIEIYHDGSGYRHFAASFGGTSAGNITDRAIQLGGASMYLRLTRTGNNWLAQYSTNGQVWTNGAAFTFAMVVRSVGPYAGNQTVASSPAPAFVGLVDYFFNTASPIVPEDSTGATLTRTVTGQGSITVDPDLSAYYNNEIVTITAVPAPGWEFQGWSGDLSGTTASQMLTMSTSRTVHATFITPAVAEPVSDDFNSAVLDTHRWTIVNPLGDAEFATEGTNTADARLRISVPGETSHAIWTDGINAPRVMQPVGDTDFSVEAKFDSPMNSRYQMQGICVEGENNRYLRFEIYHDGSGYRHFAASFSGTSAGNVTDRAIQLGGAPIYLRLTRTGSNWLAQYSANGQAWTNGAAFTFAITVRSIGPYVGNQGVGGPAPAFVGLIDYFFNTARPIVPEDVPGTTLTRTVTGQGSILAEPDQPVYYNNEVVTLIAVPEPGWVFQGWGGDLSGAEDTQTLTMIGSRLVHAIFVQPMPALSITNLAVSTQTDSARITVTTNLAARATLRYGTTTAYELGQLHNSAYDTQNVFDLTGLSPGTQYHYTVACTTPQGESRSTPDAVFTTQPLPPAGIWSEDFNSYNLNPQLWTIVDPLGDAHFSMVGTNTVDARLRIDVPAGPSHVAWTDGFNSPRVMQPAENTDFSVQAKFDSPLTSQYQMQGICVEGDNQRSLCIEFYYDGSNYRYFAAAFAGASVSNVTDTIIAGSTPMYLRLTRSGNNWAAQYSTNGQSWTAGSSFTFPMTVRAVGPFAGNETLSSNPAPAFVGLIDYFFNTAQPINPEDGGQVTDTFAPNIYTVRSSSGAESISLTWKTDEPASSFVEYGLTTQYEAGEVYNPALKTSHSVTLTGLAGSSTYNIRIHASDANGNTSHTDNFTAISGAGTGPDIVVWYGDTQEFGHIGTPQPRVNVLGNVSSPAGMASLSYSLNGSSFRPLSMGPNTMRLARLGDFNIDIPFADLAYGPNNVLIRGVDWQGRQANRSVTVYNWSGPYWPLPYYIDWSNVDNINDVAQVVDGYWEIQGGTVRSTVMAYDRLIAIGGLSYRNYEATVPITVHALDPNGYAPPSYGPGVGLLLRWPGHSNDGSQPQQGVYPLGAIGMFRWTSGYERFEIFGNNGHILAFDSSGEKMQLGVTYIFKVQVQDTASNVRYRMKWWRANQSEPSGWRLTGTQSYANDPGTGSMLLLSHHVDASFGSVWLEPLP
ncbi:MAG TPA: DUF1349 domain-containing protein [Phycisphaerae bacterium]|nr:DUF1349 domain-containing protein [Phycisphaerae bacterium]HQE29199.1 DUF1349 domain-containing protein [Phycisphaerae bacterium]